MLMSRNQYERPMSEHSPRRIVEDIDKVLLEEEKLLESLKEAVRYNNLDVAEAEGVLWDFRHEVGLIPKPDFL